jgi:hypothetical protein
VIVAAASAVRRCSSRQVSTSAVPHHSQTGRQVSASTAPPYSRTGRHVSGSTPPQHTRTRRQVSRSTALQHSPTHGHFSMVEEWRSFPSHSSKQIKILRVLHPERIRLMRRAGAVKYRCPKLLLRQPNEAPALASWRPSFGSTARRSRAEARYGVSSRPMLARSGSKSRLQFRKTHCALFQTNLPSLHWSVSSGLINLLVVRLAISLQPSSPTLSKQGPRGLARGPWTKLFPIPSSALPSRAPAGIGRKYGQRFDCQKCLIFQCLAGHGFSAFLRRHRSPP